MLTKKSIPNFLSFLTWFLSSKSVAFFESQPWNETIFATNISLAYQSILHESPFKHNPNFKEVRLLKFDSSHYDSPFLFPVLDLYRNQDLLSEFLVDFLIHGSISTLDFSLGWSDLDTLLIISDTTLKVPSSLIEFRRRCLALSGTLYKFDSLQHHEFIYTCESLLALDTAYALPHEVFKHSKSLLHSESVVLSSVHSRSASLNILKNLTSLYHESTKTGTFDHHKKYGYPLTVHIKNSSMMYQLKYFMSTVLTLPTYLYDSLGSPCYKKYSFCELESFLPKSASFLRLLESIRFNWTDRETYPYYSNHVPGWISEALPADIFRHAYLLSVEANSIIDSAR